MFLDHLKSYIEISNFERRGAFALLFSFILISGYYYHKNTSPQSEVDVDHAKLNSLIAQLEAASTADSVSDKRRSSASGNKSYKNKKYADRASLRSFDPNVDSYDELISKGLFPSIAQNIVNFRNKGGRFNQKRDVLKLYGVNDKSYQKLEPFITLSKEYSDPARSDSHEKNSSIDSTEKSLRNEPRAMVNINTATIEELKKVSGIGDFYAKNIIELRSKLGGFCCSEQLNEVFGMKEETMVKISPFLVFDAGYIQRLNINAIRYEDLAKHPYVSYKEARAIVNYRDQHGKFIKTRDLEKLHILKDKNLNKLLPYLDVN